MICKLCNKAFGNKGIGFHLLRKHNLTTKEYYDIYIQGSNECVICGKPTTFISVISGYHKHCCPTCAQLDDNTREKYKETCLKKYGTENVFSSDYGKDKIKEFYQNKYGVNHCSQISEIKDKIKNTMLERYGVENPQQNTEIKEKTNRTNLMRYGNAYPLHTDEIWKKAVQTMKSNGNQSSLEEKLEQCFINNSIEYKTQYKDERYPFFCDFYLPDKDLFIEINAFWMHGGHWFDESNPEDIEQLNKFFEIVNR